MRVHSLRVAPTDAEIEAAASNRFTIGYAGREGKTLYAVRWHAYASVYSEGRSFVWAADAEEAKDRVVEVVDPEFDTEPPDWDVNIDGEPDAVYGSSAETVRRLESNPNWAGPRGQMFLDVQSPPH